MEQSNEIYALYDAYLQKVEELERNRRPIDGLFGIIKGPKDDPCHEKFGKDLEEKLNELAASGPGPEEVSSLLEYMYSMPLQYRDNKLVYWMFAAVHILATDLIRYLDSSDAKKLYQQYQKDFPRWERMPAQKKTLKALKERISS